jgi:hypothetical protein
MAIKPVVGYTGSGWSYPSAKAPAAKPITYKPLPLSTGGVTGGGSLASAIGGGQSNATQSTIGGGGIGSSLVSPLTTTRTVIPNVVGDYQNQILSDPSSVAAQGTYDTTAGMLANARRDAIQRAIYNSGWNPNAAPGGIPTSLQSYTGDWANMPDPSSNVMSTKAQLDKQLSDANYQLPYQLAASGSGRSGAYDINSANLLNQYNTASYGGIQDLLGSILGSVGTYNQGIGDAANTLDAARRAVADRLAQQAGYSESIVTSGGDGGGGDYTPDPVTGYYPPQPIPSVVKKVIASISAKPVSANRSGATAQRGRGIISIH